MSGIVRQTKTTKINEVGEIIETEKEQIINFQKTDDFIMTFTKDLGYLKNLSKGEIVVFFGLLQIHPNKFIVVFAVKKNVDIFDSTDSAWLFEWGDRRIAKQDDFEDVICMV